MKMRFLRIISIAILIVSLLTYDALNDHELSTKFMDAIFSSSIVKKSEGVKDKVTHYINIDELLDSESMFNNRQSF
ncbi:MAG: hypothetical protein QM500_19850 [Methylococcales bacterium]